MSTEEFDLQKYMTAGVENIVKGALKATLSDPKESLFMVQYAAASAAASRRRAKLKEEGEEIPPFLIASITSSCNLHCAGCYSRANHACSDAEPVSQLTTDEWKKIFKLPFYKKAISFQSYVFMIACGVPFKRIVLYMLINVRAWGLLEKMLNYRKGTQEI